MSPYKLLRKSILEILIRVAPFAMPESQLRIELGAIIPPPTRADIDDEMDFLAVKKHIITVADESQEGMKEVDVNWTISKTGRVIHSQLN